MGKSIPVSMQEVAQGIYQFEEFLSRMILSIGSAFNYVSNKTRKCLHTGYWRTYVFTMFFAIILFILISFWMAGV